MKYHRDYKPLVEAALEQGWTLDVTSKNHPLLRPPPGQKDRQGGPARPLTIPSSPSDHRSLLNTRRDMRYNGIEC